VLVASSMLWFKAKPAYILIALGASAYGAWASYWGIVGLSGGLMDRGHSRGVRTSLRFLSHHYGLLGVVGLPLILGILYGVCGGGAYQFLQNRRLMKNPGLLPM
jgi:hypothetical protein